MACEDLQTRYDALRVAYDKWLTTGGVVTVKHGEKMIGRSPMNGPTLRLEMNRAKDALDACNGVGIRRRIIRVVPIG
jgi:hypothetical protein